MVAIVPSGLVCGPYTASMSARAFDPLRLDVPACAEAAAQLQGEWPLQSMHRLAAAAHAVSPLTASDQVVWSVRAEQHRLPGGAVQPWLHLKATARLALECQRCLQPVECVIDVDRSFVFVPGESAAAELDAQIDADVLALTRALDLRELVEDEMLLALPVVPRHEVCPQPLPISDDTLADESRPNPFAALATLKRGGGTLN